MTNYLAREGSAFSEMSNNIRDIFHFDFIHVEKLLEISQYSIISFWLALLISNVINGWMKESRIKVRSTPTRQLALKVTGYTLVIVISAKYIPKIVKAIPFIGWWDSHYKPNWHGEATYGIATAMGLAFYTVLYNYFGMIGELAYRLNPTAHELTRQATQVCRMKDGSHVQAWGSCDLHNLPTVYQEVD
jgi:hypothetical protein